MVQRDYILRMIEQFGEFWSALVKLKGQGQHREALALIDVTRGRLLGLDAASVDVLSAEALIGLVRLGVPPQLGRTVLTDRLTALALLLREEAEVRDALGHRERGDDRALKALQIALATLADDLAASPRAAAIVEPTVARLAGHELPADTADQLWGYYERAGQFARAEDWLFALLDGGEAPDEIVARGLAFYERLAALPDRALQEGNLPRAEVAAGLAELRARGGWGG